MSRVKDEPLCPKDIEEILPLIANGTFALRDHPEIRDELEARPLCHQELKEFMALREATLKEAEEIQVPEKEMFENITNTLQQREEKKRFFWLMEKLKEGMTKFVPSPAIGFAFAVAILILFVQFGMILHQRKITATYKTLSGTVTLSANRVVLNIIFNPRAREKAIEGFLESQKAQIIKGPGPGGVYQITVPKPDNLEQFLKSLRIRKDLIIFVEKRD